MDLKATLKTIKINEPTISTILGAIVLLTVALLLFNTFRSKTQTGSITNTATTSIEESAKPGGKHTVAKGEHLWGIAEKYYKSGYNWVDIAEANNLTNANLLTEGSELTIPEVTVKLATVEESANLAQAPPTDQAISGGEHLVAQGDHLWNIAVRAYGDGYKWTEIAKANNLPNPNLIFVDQKLTLPR